MPTFVYRVLDPATNAYSSISVEAGNQEEASRMVIQRGVTPLSVKQTKTSIDIFKRVNRKQRSLFTSQLATLLGAGLPLLQSLKNVREQTRNNTLKQYINDFITSIESGVSFSAALAKYPKVFDQIYINLVRSGEISGTLDVSLKRLALQQEKDNDLLSKIKGAMVYPIIVVFVMIGVVVFMLVGVLPAVGGFYEEFDKELPGITQLLLNISGSLQTFWYLYIIGFAGVVFGILRFRKTNTGRRFLDQAKLKIPILKKMFSSVYMARFSRTMATLFSAGITLLDALSITKQSINNVHVEEAIESSSNKVKEGGSLSQSMTAEEYFDNLVIDMIKIGEESGQTEEMLFKSATHYEKEVDKNVKTLTTLMEPAMILSLGGIAIFMVLAILMPLYSLLNETGGA